LKLRYQSATSFVLGVPVHIAVPRGLLVSLLVVLACSHFFSNALAGVAVAAVVGLSAQILGALMYKLERAIVRVIAN
jgi:hypothetical protein